MNFTDLLTDDDAVSPVIGVILMVAITVILAAVIGTFVLGLGDQVGNTAPQASFGFDFEEDASGIDSLTITHESGDSIAAQRLSLTASSKYSQSDDGSTDEGTSNKFHEISSLSATSEVKAGTSITVYGYDDDSDSAADLTSHEFRIVWTSEGGDSSATLQKWTGPDA